MRKGITVMAAGVILFTAGEILLFMEEMHSSVSMPAQKIIFISPMANTGYWGIAAGGIREKAEQYGIHVKCVGFSELDVEKQVYALENAILSGVDGIITAPNEVTPEYRKTIQEAEAAGIPVVFVDSNAKELACSCYVGTDNSEAGKLAGEKLAEVCGGTAEIAVITSFQTNTNQKARIEGFQEALKNYSNMKIKAILEGESNRVLLNEKISGLLDEHPEITAVFCAEGYGSKSICMLREKNEERYQNLKIVTFDSIDTTLKAVEQGVIDAAIVQNPREMGMQAMNIMKQLLERKTEKIEDQYMEVLVVDADNVKDVSYISQEEIPWQIY